MGQCTAKCMIFDGPEVGLAGRRVSLMNCINKITLLTDQGVRGVAQVPKAILMQKYDI